MLVVLNDEINGARDVTKTDALRLNTFASRSFGALGVVDADRVVFRRTAEGRHTAASEFDVATIETLPRVDVFLVYQGAPGDLIKAAIDLGARGVVLATAGAGATSGTQDQGVEYAREKGVPVVVATTRAGSGRVAGPQRAVPAAAARRIVGRGPVRGEGARAADARADADADTAELQRIFERVLTRVGSRVGTGTSASSATGPPTLPTPTSTTIGHDDRGHDAGHQVHRDGEEQESRGDGHAIRQYRRERRDAGGRRGGQAAEHVERCGNGEAARQQQVHPCRQQYRQHRRDDDRRRIDQVGHRVPGECRIRVAPGKVDGRGRRRGQRIPPIT